MNTHCSRTCGKKTGFTLLEMTLVIAIMLALIGVGFVGTNKITEWRAGREACETLRTVWSAQRQFLSDNPTVVPANITAAQLLPYLPTKGATALPEIKSLTGSVLVINVNVYPPTVSATAGGAVYDPSKKSADGLWDVGE
jgi:prepilin-type N-terminal cleavage/methylation domain-containing protein